MLKMWKAVDNIIRQEQGTAVVEVSFIVPLLIFLMAGIFLFSLSVIDIAAVKNYEIITAHKSEISQSTLENETVSLLISSADNCKTESQIMTLSVKMSVHGKLPWKGLQDYMQTKYSHQIVTKTLRDNRRKWMLEKELLKNIKE